MPGAGDSGGSADAVGSANSVNLNEVILLMMGKGKQVAQPVRGSRQIVLFNDFLYERLRSLLYV